MLHVLAAFVMLLTAAEQQAAIHQQRNSKGNAAASSIERSNTNPSLPPALPYTAVVLLTGIDRVSLPVVVRVFSICFVVFLMRETALPRLSFVIAISMRYAGFNVGQRVVVRFREFGFSVVVSLLRFRVSVPVVMFAVMRLGFGFAEIGLSLRLR